MKKLSLLLVLLLCSIYVFPQGIQFNQVVNWSGSGQNVAMLVVDFNNGQTPDCFAFGYRFDGSKTAEDMLNDIAAANQSFTVNMGGGFLNDITWESNSGIGGSPDYWSTFTFDSIDWIMNWGIAEVLTDSVIFGCSYTEWYQVDSLWFPVNLPENPVPAASGVDITEFSNPAVHIFPNPAADFLRIETSSNEFRVFITDVSGKAVAIGKENRSEIDITHLSAGFYMAVIVTEKGNISRQFVKK
jgi:hypothetical protein